MGVQKGQEPGAGDDSRFAQQPADRFVDQIMTVLQQESGDAKGVIGLAALEKSERGDNGDAALPEVRGCGERVEDIAGTVDEMLAQNVAAGSINKIPVVEQFCIAQIEAANAFAASIGFGRLILIDQNFCGSRAVFVKGGTQETLNIRQGETGEAQSRFANDRNRDAQEAIAFAILAFTGFEKPGEALGAFRIG
jgi:hypothetical protein